MRVEACQDSCGLHLHRCRRCHYESGPLVHTDACPGCLFLAEQDLPCRPCQLGICPVHGLLTFRPGEPLRVDHRGRCHDPECEGCLPPGGGRSDD